MTVMCRVLRRPRSRGIVPTGLGGPGKRAPANQSMVSRKDAKKKAEKLGPSQGDSGGLTPGELRLDYRFRAGGDVR